MLKKLEEMGLVERKPDLDDRRSVRIFLTEEGLKKQEIAFGYVKTFNEYVKNLIPAKKLDTFFEVLDSIQDIIEQHKNRPKNSFRNMNRTIKKAAVLGSGIMGSGIACHLANAGIQVVLLDIVPRELNEKEQAKGLTLESPVVRNRIVNDALQSAIKGKLAPLYDKRYAKRITTGNFDDDFAKISDADLIIEAVIENLEIKHKIFDQVDQHRKKGSIVASNTSGIPIRMMTPNKSEDFQKHFLGMHFFNPPRYLRLLEIIPTELTDPSVTDFMMHWGDLYLGKQTVLCKDTPAFIANRVGLFALMKILELVEELDLTIEETDKLTGPATGKPKTGTFRLADMIGNDTTLKVKQGLHKNLPEDEANAMFGAESVLERVVAKGLLGDKTRQGFYKKTKDEQGNRKILSLDLKTMEYRDKKRPAIPSLELVKTIDDLPNRLKALYAAKDKGGELVKKSSLALFAYVSNRIPEISDDLYQIDGALCAGFGWDAGPFEVWDMLGVERAVADMKEEGIVYHPWVDEMINSGITGFYKRENGSRYYYDVASKAYKEIPGTKELYVLDNLRDTNVVWKNSGASLFDLGDGILNLEFHTKMNTIGGEVIEGINIAVDKAEQEFAGLVIANNAPNFSAGANLALILMLAIEQEWDELDFAIRTLQNTHMKMRYSSIPVVVAPHALTLGGGCEMTLHADRVVAAAETYIGLVEVGVGLIPGGGGTKEMTVRMADRYTTGDVELNELQQTFLTIGQAKVATSAAEAFKLGILRDGDVVSINTNRQIKDAKTEIMAMISEGYQAPVQRTDVKVLGRTGLGMAYSGAYAMYAANYISEHDLKIAKKLAYIMCGGDLTGSAKVSEQYLLDLEREAFLSLLGEQKTLERIQHTLKTGKPLRN